MANSYFLRIRNQLRQLGNPQPNQKIFYMHVPKCGGTSVATAIRNSFTTWDPVDDRQIAHFDPFAAHKGAEVTGSDPLAYNRNLLPYFLGVSHYRYVYGHFAFDEAAYEAFSQQWAFITLLRDPVKKWFSLYFFNRHKEADFFKVEEELETFVTSATARGYGCDYVMQFIGHDHCRDHGTVASTGDEYSYYGTDAAIERAIGNLQKFHLVGCLEQLDCFVKQFARHYGTRLQIANKNRNPLATAQQQQVISEEVVAKVRELCRPNLAVYNYALTHLLDSNT